MSSAGALTCGRFTLDLSRPQVMGIVNLTPDSFSDGGHEVTLGEALHRAEAMIEAGADLIDVGGESTRPGASEVAADEEWRRIGGFVTALRDARVPVSVDTRKPDVMRRALDAGASMINDVAGFAAAEARRAVATSTCGVCAMHMRGVPATMHVAPHYDDVVQEVASFLARRVAALIDDGVVAGRVVVDPGFGFGKDLDHNLTLLRELESIVALGRPVLVGLSRKGMIGALTGRPVGERVAGSVAAALAAVAAGAAIVRVHDVPATVDALRVWGAVRR